MKFEIESKEQLIAEIDKRLEDKIIEKTNAELLKKLIKNADSLTEAISIAELGTTYKRTGFHFDKRLEKTENTIKYFKKNENLSFVNNPENITHKLVIGDNYDALLNLLIEYRRKIDVIYIDPPYAQNKMGQFADTSYNNAITRDNLLSMLYTRLFLAKQLLTDGGMIFCSIDDKNYAYVKCLFDEIFGEKHFINTFVWKKNSSGKTEKDKFTVNTEYVLFFAKDTDYILNSVYKPLSQGTLEGYKYDDNDGRGKYATVSLQKPKNPGPETTYDYIDNNGKIWVCPSKGWRLVYSKIKELENDNRLVLTGKTLREKDYWNERENDGKRIDTLWNDLPENNVGSSEVEKIFNKNEMFDNPKPTGLLKRCVGIANKNAVVLDFFAGSGTTGHAVMELNKEDGGNRQYICVQLPENLDNALHNKKNSQTIKNQIELCDKNGRPHLLSEITAERLRRIMTGCGYDGCNNFDWVKKNKPYGDNLDVYEIATVSNSENTVGKTPFDVIDETLYGKEKFKTLKEKIDWVCNNFDNTQKVLKSNEYSSNNLEVK